MAIFLVWIVFSVVVGAIGSGRKIGFAGAFFLSLLLSPIIGIVITLISKDKQDEEYKEKILKTQQKQAETLKNLKTEAPKSVADELEKLQKLKADGVLNEEEYQKAKEKIIS